MPHLRLFGKVDLTSGPGAAAGAVLAQPKRVALLATLALSDEGVARRDRILALLWPELPDARARNALSKSVHHLRRVLGQDAVLTGPGDEIRLNPEAWTCDVWTFRDALAAGDHGGALEAAAPGPLLDAFHLGDAPDWEEWIDGHRARIRMASLSCALGMAAEAEERNDRGSAAAALSRALELAPYDEGTVRRLMRLLAAGGDRGSALEAYRQFEVRLRDGLDAEPSGDTKGLAEALRADPGITRVPAAVPRPSPDPQVREPAMVGSAPPPARRRLGIAVLGAAIVSGAVWAVLSLATEGPGSDARTGPRRVAVFPLEDGTGDPDLAAFGTVASDWIFLGLSRTGLAELVPIRDVHRLPSDADSAAGADSGSMALASSLGADLLLAGRYVTLGDSLVVSLWLLDSRSGTVVRAPDPVVTGRFTPAEALPELRTRAMGLLASLLDPNMAVAATPATRPPRYEAYLEYAAGLDPWRTDRPGEAADHFARAWSLDSSFVSVLPWLWESLALSGRSEEAQRIRTAIDLRREGLDPYDLAVVEWLGSFLTGDREGALEAGRTMARLAPGSQDANWSHGWAAVNTNRFAEARRAFAAAESAGGWMDDWAFFLHWPTLAHHLTGDFRSELAMARRFRERYPSDPRPCAYEIRALAGLGRPVSVDSVLAGCGDLADSLTSLELTLMAAHELRAHGSPDSAERLAGMAAEVADAGARLYPDQIPWRRARLDALLEAGRWEAVVDAVEGDTEPHLRLFYRAEGLGIALARMGDTAAARRALASMSEGIAAPGDSAAYFLRRIGILAHMGNPEAAADAAEAAVRRGLSPAEVMHARRALEPLAGHPRWEALLAPRN